MLWSCSYELVLQFFLYFFAFVGWKRDRKQFIYSVVVGCISTEHYMDFLGRRQLKCLCTCKPHRVRQTHSRSSTAHVFSKLRLLRWSRWDISRGIFFVMEYDVRKTEVEEASRGDLRKVFLIKSYRRLSSQTYLICFGWREITHSDSGNNESQNNLNQSEKMWMTCTSININMISFRRAFIRAAFVVSCGATHFGDRCVIGANNLKI